MKRLRNALSLLAVALLAMACDAPGRLPAAVTTLSPGKPLIDELPRYGLNLGGSGTWGAEQLRANVLANPGFEAVLDRSIVVVSARQGRTLIEDEAWVARDENFWNGAQIDVRSGAAAGATGRVERYWRRAEDGRGRYRLEAPIPGLGPGDVLVVTRHRDDGPAPRWWQGQGSFAVEEAVRPGSPGRQAVRLRALPDAPTELLHYFDNIPDRAGRLLPVEGPWRFSVWLRSDDPGARLRVFFGRDGQAPFLEEELGADPQWRRHDLTFEGNDSGVAGTLTLSLQAIDGEVVLDDAYLGETDPGPGGFRRAAVETLRQLRPGYLRDWQGQLGDTLANRLAPAQGHQPARYRKGEHEAQFHYGLPDFLALCAAIDARPWIVAPTTLDDDEWRALGAWLSAQADRHGFRELLVEFGNENWNPQFRPGAIPRLETHAAVADRAFRLLREGSADDPRLITVANAQFANEATVLEQLELGVTQDRIAVAPYFYYHLSADTGEAAAIAASFVDSGDALTRLAAAARDRGKALAVYEVNFHTTLGDAPTGLRNRVVAGASSGPALARRLLQGTLAGLREQAVYTFSGFDSYLQEGEGLVRLWGITRDLAGPGRLRPTGLALAQLNQLAGERARESRCSGPACAELTAVWYGKSRLAVVAAGDQPTALQLAVGCDAPWTLTLLDGSLPARDNEQHPAVQADTVPLACDAGVLTFTLPPWSLATVAEFAKSSPLRNSSAGRGL